jgi:hypothetical protein
MPPFLSLTLEGDWGFFSWPVLVWTPFSFHLKLMTLNRLLYLCGRTRKAQVIEHSFDIPLLSSFFFCLFMSSASLFSAFVLWVLEKNDCKRTITRSSLWCQKEKRHNTLITSYFCLLLCHLDTTYSNLREESVIVKARMSTNIAQCNETAEDQYAERENISE